MADVASDLLQSRPFGVWFDRARPVATAPDRGAMPAFVGIVAGGSGGPGFVAERWEDAAAMLLPGPPGGRLAAAVQAFFANGGARCLIVPTDEADGADGLVAALDPESPLAERTDVNLLCLPDTVTSLVDARFGEDTAEDELAEEDPTDPAEQDWAGEAVRRVHAAMLDHCALTGDRFALLDAPRSRARDSAAAYARLLGDYAGGLRSPYGALYAPWLIQPVAAASMSRRSPGWRAGSAAGTRLVAVEHCPPSGHVAGLIARLDATVGPQRAPAGLPLERAIDVDLPFGTEEVLALRRARVNPLLRLAEGGVQVGGAHTLTGHAAWSRVSAARIVTEFRRWLAHGMADLAFELSGPALWDKIEVRLRARCRALFSGGALAGRDPDQAFFVKCDAETNPADEIERGRVIALVGLAPTTPAEFIILRLAPAPGAELVSSVIKTS